MHLCKGCETDLPISEFRLRNGKPVWRCRPCERNYQREAYKKNPEKYRAKSRKAGFAKRHDPETRDDVLAKQRAYYHKAAKYRERQYYEEIKANKPWEWRARNLRRNIAKDITAKWLKKTFDLQKGLCALSGRPIDVSSFHVDHVVPKSKGGADELSNLRLVCEEANLAKSSLSDSELVQLCKDILVTMEAERATEA